LVCEDPFRNVLRYQILAVQDSPISWSPPK
jgi:hypothetical protein